MLILQVGGSLEKVEETTTTFGIHHLAGKSTWDLKVLKKIIFPNSAFWVTMVSLVGSVLAMYKWMAILILSL